MEEYQDYLSDLMDMYGNHVITSKEYFNRAMEHGIPHEIIEEYWDVARWRVNKKTGKVKR